MKDFYRHLGLSDAAPEGALRTALATAEPATREAGEFILLDPARREVYDRNRRVLATIGRLRANLGLNLTRFWPRSRFADFTQELAPTPTGHSATDPMSMAWAFGVEPMRPRERRWPLLARAVAAACVAGIAAAALYFAWRLRNGG